MVSNRRCLRATSRNRIEITSRKLIHLQAIFTASPMNPSTKMHESSSHRDVNGKGILERRASMLEITCFALEWSNLDQVKGVLITSILMNG